MALFTVAVALLWCHPDMARGYSLNPQLAQVLSGENGTHFGYSVALWADPSAGKKLVIGAPRWQYTRKKYSVPLTLGQLHICTPPDYNCQPHPSLPFFSNKRVGWSLSPKDLISRINFIKSLDIGFPETLHTVSSGSNHSMLVACAPRYPLVSRTRSGYQLNSGGACYILNDMEAEPSLFVPYPVQLLANGRPIINSQQHTGCSLAGFSAAISQNESFLFMGGPYAYIGQGTVSRVSNLKRDVDLRSSMQDEEEFDYVGEGWAIVAGNFGGKNGNESLAVSSPNSVYGQVRFYSVDLKRLDTPLLEGDHWGGKFGYSLSVGDYDGDSASDLIVGAPYHPGYRQGLDRGAIFIYYAPTKEGPQTRERQEVKSPKSGRDWGLFGLSLTSVDLDMDGYHDVVVGEPGGAGAIHVFMGGSKGLSSQPSQTISASDFPIPQFGFGFSLTSGSDVDNDGYPDLLVGAPMSDTAVFIRSSPVVWLDGQVKFMPEMISLAQKLCQVEGQPGVCFDIEFDLAYTSEKPLGPIEMMLEMVLDEEQERAAFMTTNSSRHTENRVLNIIQSESHPWKIAAFIKPGRPLMETPLDVKVTAKIADPHSLPSGTAPPVMGPSVLSANASLFCPSDLACLTRTDLNVSINGQSDVIIGEDDIEIKVTINAKDNAAYSVCCSIIYNHQLNFQRVSGDTLIPTCISRPNNVAEFAILSCCFSTDINEDMKISARLHFSYSVPELMEFLISFDPAPEISTQNPTTADNVTSETHTKDNVTSEYVTSDSEYEVTPFTLPSPDLTNGSSPDSTSPRLTFSIKVKSDMPDLRPEDNMQNLTLPLYSKVDLQLSGQSIPDTAEGNLNRSLSLKYLTPGLTIRSPSLLGPAITHTYFISNRGPSPMRFGGKLHFFFPLELDGRPLVYPITDLFISGPIFCQNLTLNPLNFTFRDYDIDENATETQDFTNSTAAVAYTPDSVTYTPDSVTYTRDSVTYTSDSVTYNPTMNTRTPDPTRVSARKVPTKFDKLLRENGGSSSVDCHRVKCEILTCELGEMSAGEIASVSISGYAVLSMLKDTTGKTNIEVRSEGILEVKREKYQMLGNAETADMNTIYATAKTQVLITGRTARKVSLSNVWHLLPFWMWIVLVAIGLLIIAMISALLFVFGFFKRKEIPERPEGTPEEIVPLESNLSPKINANSESTKL